MINLMAIRAQLWRSVGTISRKTSSSVANHKAFIAHSSKNKMTDYLLKLNGEAYPKIRCVKDIVELSVQLKLGDANIWGDKIWDLNEERHHPHTPSFKYPFGLWFRGHGSNFWSLIPSIFRDKVHIQDETSMFHHFRLLNPDYARTHKTTFEWLTLLQHYGTPTRLLDWSESLLVSLYFAAEKIPNSKGLYFYFEREDGIIKLSCGNVEFVLNSTKIIEERCAVEIYKSKPNETGVDTKEMIDTITISENEVADVYNLIDESVDQGEKQIFLNSASLITKHLESKHKFMAEEVDGAIWILNASRLNCLSNVSKEMLGIAIPSYFNVFLRSETALVNDVSSLSKRLISLNTLHVNEVDHFSPHEIRESFKNLGNPLEQKSGFCEKLSMPVAVYPSRISPRLKAQSSVFTIHGGKQYAVSESPDKQVNDIPQPAPLLFLAKENEQRKRQRPFLAKIKVDGSKKQEIRQHLFEIGVHKSSMFDGLDHQSEFIKQQWKKKKR